LLVIDMWEQRDASLLRNVIRYRDDKFSHQVEVRTVQEIEAVAELGWFDESAALGRKLR
jgi:hypothetical protein